jgi:hypothetical protein
VNKDSATQPIIKVKVIAIHDDGRVEIEGDGAYRAPRLLPDE